MVLASISASSLYPSCLSFAALSVFDTVERLQCTIKAISRWVDPLSCRRMISKLLARIPPIIKQAPLIGRCVFIVEYLV